MKNCFFLFLLTLSFSTLKAQEFYGGVLGGINGSQIEGDYSAGYQKLGLVGGVWVQRDLSDRFYWGMELKFNQKGSRILPTFRNQNRVYLNRLNYIDLPVLLGFQYKPFLSFFSGLSYGYLMNDYVYDNINLSASNTNFSKWEMGMFIGAKVDFNQLINRDWAKKLMLETRWQYSTLSIDKSHDFFTTYLSLGQFNNVISTVLYYRIGKHY